MDRYELLGYPLFFVVALEIFLGLILLRQNPRKSPVNKAVAVFSFASAGYALCTGVIYVRTSLGLPIDVIARANWVGWLSIPAALQSIFYMEDEKSRKARIVGFVLYSFWSLMLVLCLFTELVEPAGYSLKPHVDNTGPLENPARLFGALQILWVMYEVSRLRQKSAGARRAQVNYFFLGTVIFGGGSALIAGFLQLFGGLGLDPGLGAYFSFPWVVLTFYAITRYRLFDISLLISRLLTIVSLSLLVSVLHIWLFKLFEPLMGASLAILFSLFLIGTVFFGTHLSREVQWRIQTFILKDRYDYQLILKESIKASIAILDLDELLDHLAASIRKSLDAQTVRLLLKERNGQYVPKHGTRREEGSDYEEVPNAVISWLRRVKHVIVRAELEILLPSQEFKMVDDYMSRIKAELLIPLFYKGELQGFFTLGRKGNGEPYLQSDVDLLELLASQAAIAIENAQLYEEARRARESMRESEAKFRTLAETAAIGIFIHRGGNILYANPASEMIAGYTLAEYSHMNFTEVVHPDFVEVVRTRARERLSGSSKVPPQYELKIVRKNGEERWVLMTAGIAQFDGQPAVIGTLIDITERKKAENEREEYYRQLQLALQSLKESELRFRTLAETTTAAIFIHQGQRLVYANTAGEIMTGYSREELLNEDFWALIHPDYQELAKERGRAFLVGDLMPKEYEFKYITKKGDERWAATTAGVIEYGGKSAIIATLFDITEWKRAEEAKVKFYDESVRQYQERIEEEKRYRLEKEKILMDLHDGIGGITTNISILSELALKGDPEHAAKLLSTISRLSREGISEIRSFMHGLDGKELNWRTLAAELRSQGTNMVETHNILFSIRTELADIREQPGSLTWVNIFKIYKEALTNVIKHSKASAVEVGFSVSRGSVRLTIRDNGVGVSGERRSGGRGLSHMKTRAQDIGGSVTVLNGQGTTVQFQLPLPLKYPAAGIVS